MPVLDSYTVGGKLHLQNLSRLRADSDWRRDGKTRSGARRVCGRHADLVCGLAFPLSSLYPDSRRPSRRTDLRTVGEGITVRPTCTADADRAFEIKSDWNVTRGVGRLTIRQWFADHRRE